MVKKTAVYVVMGINSEGQKDVLSIEIGDVESSKYWLGVLTNLKNRGVKDIMIICADGLIGIKEAIEAAYPMTEYQHCIAVSSITNTSDTAHTINVVTTEYNRVQPSPVVEKSYIQYTLKAFYNTYNRSLNVFYTK